METSPIREFGKKLRYEMPKIGNTNINKIMNILHNICSLFYGTYEKMF